MELLMSDLRFILFLSSPPLRKTVMTGFSGLLRSQISQASKLMKVILVHPTSFKTDLSRREVGTFKFRSC